jgi:hypothetical protein
MDIRVLRPSDIPHVQLANITNLPENYFCKYYLYHAMSWPQLSYVAVDVSFVHSDYMGGKWPAPPWPGTKRTQKKEHKRARKPVLERKKKTGKQLSIARRVGEYVSAVLQLHGRRRMAIGTPPCEL